MKSAISNMRRAKTYRSISVSTIASFSLAFSWAGDGEAATHNRVVERHGHCVCCASTAQTGAAVAGFGGRRNGKC